MKGKLMEEKDLYVDDVLDATTDQEIEEILKTPVRNNAMLVPMGGLVPIEDYELYKKDDNVEIWKGKLVIPGKSDTPDIIYFSRFYQPDINDLDKIFVEIEITDLNILGVPFILVPKEKFLFGYFKGSDTIVIPKINLAGSRPHMQ